MSASEKLEPVKIMYFLGAGASIEAGLHTITELTDEFLKEPKKHGAWLNPKVSNEEKIKDSLNIISDATRDYFHGKMDLELMMSLILRLQDKKEKEIFDAKYSDLKKINEEMLDNVKNLAQSFIRNECENIITTEYFWPLEGMSNKEKLNIFSLNYDGIIEIFCENRGIKYTDGFDPDWNPERFSDDRNRINLFKLHGSLYWFRTKGGKTIKIPVKGLDTTTSNYLTGEGLDEMMIYPALEKNKQSEVYSWLSQKFKDELRQSHVCVIIGYSFRDDDIKNSIIESLQRNLDLWIILVNPHASKLKMDLTLIDENLSSRIVSMDMGTREALTDRILHHNLESLETARKGELNAWESQSSTRVRLDQMWTHSLLNYLRVGHYDRVKWIVEELAQKRFEHPNQNFPDNIEGIVCPKSLSFAIDYRQKKQVEKIKIWCKIFAETCLCLEYKFFANSNIVPVMKSNPIQKNELPFYCMDGGTQIFTRILELNNELKLIKEKQLERGLENLLEKMIDTFDFILDKGRNAYVNRKPDEILIWYQTNDRSLKRWSQEITKYLLN